MYRQITEIKKLKNIKVIIKKNILYSVHIVLLTVSISSDVNIIYIAGCLHETQACHLTHQPQPAERERCCLDNHSTQVQKN